MQINYIVKASNKRRALHYWKKLNSKIFLSSWRFLEEAKAQAASNHWSTVMKESSYNDAKKTTTDITSYNEGRTQNAASVRSNSYLLGLIFCHVSDSKFRATFGPGRRLFFCRFGNLTMPGATRTTRRSIRRILKFPKLEDTNKDLHHSA